MNRKLRLGLALGTLLATGAARAATTAIQPWNPEEARVAASAQNPSGFYLDYTTCSPREIGDQARAQQQALSLPDQDRGPVIASGGCAVKAVRPNVAQIDDQYRR